VHSVLRKDGIGQKDIRSSEKYEIVSELFIWFQETEAERADQL